MRHMTFNHQLMSMIVTLGLFAATTVATADAFSSDYPGMYPGHDGAATNIAYSHVVTGASCYFMIYGVWPDSWQDVVDAGLVQVPLFGFSLEAIDPDDNKLDSSADVVYSSSSAGSAPQVISRKNSVSGQPSVNTISAPTQTLKQMCNTFIGMLEQSGNEGDQALIESWQALRDDSNRQAQVALALAINISIREFYATKGEWPATWDEFLSSGFSPVDSSSVNPYNGLPIKADGSSNDYIFLSEGASYIYATDSAGETPWTIR